MKSSYKYNNYHMLFEAMVQITRPECCVELGVLEGYSTLAIGNALKDIKVGHLFAYDVNVLLTMYEKVQNLPVTLRDGDAYEVWSDFQEIEIDFLHIDISNNGTILRDLIELWNPKVKPGGIIIFEGSSLLRDEIEWMNKYNKEKIYPEVKTNKILEQEYSCVILHYYPSVLMCSKNINTSGYLWSKFGYDNYGKE